MRLQRYLITHRDGSTPEVLGYPQESGLAVRQRDTRRWGIDHLPTGYSVNGMRWFASYRKALAACNELANLCDWNKVGMNDLSVSDFRDQVRLIFDRHAT